MFDHTHIMDVIYFTMSYKIQKSSEIYKYDPFTLHAYEIVYFIIKIITIYVYMYNTYMCITLYIFNIQDIIHVLFLLSLLIFIIYIRQSIINKHVILYLFIFIQFGGGNTQFNYIELVYIKLFKKIFVFLLKYLYETYYPIYLHNILFIYIFKMQNNFFFEHLINQNYAFYPIPIYRL